jgi:DNA topoisomerase VI subunit A/intein/homing endonuclease
MPEETKKRLSKLGNEVHSQLSQVKNPDINLPIRALSNIYFDEKKKLIRLGDKVSHRTYLNVAHTRKFMQTMMVAAECKKIIDQNVTISIRDLYYALKRTIPETNENTFEEQGESDPIIEDIEAAMNTLREKLNLKADRKGYMAGQIKIHDRGDIIDASKMGSSGWGIPSNVEPENIKLTNNKAKYVLCLPGNEMMFVLENGNPSLVKISDLFERGSVDNLWVMSHDDSYNTVPNRVAAIHKREKRPGERIIKIKLRSGSVIRITEDHKIPVLTESGIRMLPAKGIKTNDFLLETRRIKMPASLPQAKEIDLLQLLPESEIAESVRVTGASYLLNNETASDLGLYITKDVDGKTYTYPYRYLTNGWKDRDSVPLDSYMKLKETGSDEKPEARTETRIFTLGSKRKDTVPSRIMVDNGFARLLGYYLAEGHTHRNTVGFSFGAHEEEYHREVCGLITDIFGIKPVMYRHKNRVQIFIQNKIVTWLFRHLGTGSCSTEKRVPDFVYGMPEEFIKNLLQAYLNGDGYAAGPSYPSATVSKELHYGINLLFRIIGVPTYRAKRKNKGFEGYESLPLYYTFIVRKHFDGNAEEKSRHLWERYPLFLVRKEPGKKEFRSYFANNHRKVNRCRLVSSSLQEVRTWLDADVHPVEVRSVEYEECPEELYDISCVLPSHVYMHGSGIFIHNCIEKDAVWQRLNEDRFWQKQNCLIITGKGQPDRGTRRLINRLHNELKLPVYVLTDADAWGYYIYSVIKQGSINLSFLSDRLGTPEAKFIGLTTKDVETFQIPRNVTIKLNKGDHKRAKEMLNYVWFKPKEWQSEIKHMLQVDHKLELEALSAKGIRFISETYLPQKIKQKDFLP